MTNHAIYDQNTQAEETFKSIRQLLSREKLKAKISKGYIIDQVILEKGATFKWRNPDCHFQIGTYPNIWKIAGKQESIGG